MRERVASGRGMQGSAGKGGEGDTKRVLEEHGKAMESKGTTEEGREMQRSAGKGGEGNTKRSTRRARQGKGKQGKYIESQRNASECRQTHKCKGHGTAGNGRVRKRKN